jgi:multiple sugar transport system substrate-binding protein
MKKKSFISLGIIMAGLFLSLSVYAGGTADRQPVQEKVELVVFSHMVHQRAMEGVEGGGKNLVQEFISLHPEVSGVRFITAGTPQVRDKLFREAALPKTEFDISLVYTPWISPSMPDFFVPLDEYMEKSPIEDFNDIFENLREELIVGGKTYGIPMRASGEGLYYNKKILAERGIPNPPSSLEELIEDIKKCTFTRPNGEAVYGLARMGNQAEIAYVVGDYLRAKDGDYLSAQYEPRFSDPRVIEAVNLFKEFMEIKALPPNFFTMENKDMVELFKRGRAAFAGAGPGYLVQFTGADGLAAEDVGYMNYQASNQYKTRYPAASPTVTFQWGFVIPRGCQHKELAWEFIRFMCSKEGVLNMSLSGNEPFRNSTFQDQRYIVRQPLLTQQQNIFKYGRPLFKGFDNFTEANNILGEEIQKAIMGQKTAQQAMADAERQIKPLLP